MERLNPPPSGGGGTAGDGGGGHGTEVLLTSPAVRQAPDTSRWRGRISELNLDTTTLFVIPAKAGTPRREGTPAIRISTQSRHPSESWGIPVMEHSLAARDPSFRWGDGEGRRTLPSSSPRACSGVHGSALSRLSSVRNGGCRNEPGMTDYLKRSANRVPGRRRCASSIRRWASCTSRQGSSRRSGCTRW